MFPCHALTRANNSGANRDTAQQTDVRRFATYRSRTNHVRTRQVVSASAYGVEYLVSNRVQHIRGENTHSPSTKEREASALVTTK